MSAGLPPENILTAIEARVLGVLFEKEFTTPDAYPLTLNSLVNGCNQKSNRAPVMELGADEVENAIEGLRAKALGLLFSGADARVPKFKHSFDRVYPIEVGARALLTELLLRGPQTAAELRARTERLFAQSAASVEAQLEALAEPEAGPLVVRLPRQVGKKEARWAQLLTGEPDTMEPSGGAEPIKVNMILPPEVEARLLALEGEVVTLRAELQALREALGEA